MKISALHLGRLLAALLLPVHAMRAAEEPIAEPAPAKAPLRDSALFEPGRFVYEQHCIVCHGARGDGQGEMAASLPIKPRHFNTGLFKYRSTPWGKLPTTDDLLRTVRNGRTGTAMGMFTFLSEEELRAVVEYVKFFSREWRKPENHAPPVELPAEPNWFGDSAERATHVVAGRRAFEAACAACHGPTGDGHGPAAAALKDAVGEPATPADLRQPHLRSGDEPLDLIRVLMTGLNGTPMVSFADTLSAEQKWEIAAYILSLRREWENATPAPAP